MRITVPKKLFGMLCCLSLLWGVAACDSAIYDGEGDCSYRNGVRFVYDRNMKFADAFPHEVKAVTLYVFDKEGRLVSRYSDEGAALGKAGYVLPVDVKPGTYSLLAWCTWDKQEGVEALPFEIPEATPDQSVLTELTARLERGHDGAARAVVDKDIRPLFHGYVHEAVFSDEPGDHVVPIELTKNTNSIRVMLQHLSGEAVDADKFRFSITSANGKMAHDNSLMSDETLRYDAWHVGSGNAEIETENGVVNVHTAVAELTLARLVVEDKPVLTVTNDKGERVLSVPLIDYLLMVKGYYNRQMEDQEYLDRQDEYSLTFFLDDNLRWDETHIIVNSWAVVINNGSAGGGWEP